MRFKILTVVAAAALLTACASDEENSAQSTDQGQTQTATAPAPAPAATAPAPSGPKAGSVEDFVVTAGDRVYFELDSSEITGAAQTTLARQAKWLNAFPGVVIRVEGHCDERGTREYNLALGDRRANSVKEFLMSQGVNGSRIETISYGKERPAVAGSTEAAWSQNRRGVTTLASGAAS